jgi:BCD family chlorophyll transporter-like MFS transporter
LVKLWLFGLNIGEEMTVKRIQLGFIHVAVAITLVPINSTLNRIMIKELALSATLVAVLASLPYVFSPIQVAIGSFSDRHPILGWRRTPYIFIGLLLCVVGVIVAPHIAFLLAENFWLGILVGLLAFGAWGMGYNLASVSYFSLATELSGENGRSRTIAVMFFMMIISIIITASTLSKLLEVYSPEVLISSFRLIGLVALVFGALGLIKLENKTQEQAPSSQETYSWKQMAGAITKNKQAARFVVYLILLLTAILGQDILLEPYGAEAFDMTVQETTRITSIWGVFFLVALTLGGILENRIHKLVQARIGGWSGIVSFSLIVLSSVLHSEGLFYAGVILLGFATGLATVSNLSLMLDMTTGNSIGLFMGAWGMASALARLTGNLLSGVVRDSITALTSNNVIGYSVVFTIEIGLLLVSLALLRHVDIKSFLEDAEQQLSYFERAALANEA